MAKFNKPTPMAASGIQTSTHSDTTTFGGQRGYSHDPRSELFLSAVSSLTDNTFYESESGRLTRQRVLVGDIAVGDPRWMLSFLRWLRDDARIRTASLIIAADAVHARLAAGAADNLAPGERGINRQLIEVVLQRPDEPGEMLAYWHSQYGRTVPKPVKRGVADAVVRLYHQRSLLKYDGTSKGFRFGDVIELTHPKASSPQQGALFRYAIDRRHNRDTIDIGDLPMIVERERLKAQPAELIHRLADQGTLPDILAAAGMTWEAVPSLVDGPWTPQLWESIIPSMGVMALARNLRNFDAAGVSPQMAQLVSEKLFDAAGVERSRILPMRLLSAYRAAPSVRWHAPLEAALQHSLAAIPRLDGHTLILVDRSGSMFYSTSQRSDLTFADTAAVFGTALALRAKRATLVEFGTLSNQVHVPKGGSVLPMLSRFSDLGGTDTARALRGHLRPEHTRAVILTDEQYTGHGADPGAVVPAHVPLHTFNLVGYRQAHAAGSSNRYWYGGLSDASWPLIMLNENSSRGRWPWDAVKPATGEPKSGNPKPDKPTVTVSETVTVLSDSGAHNQYAEPGIGPQTVVGPDTLVWSPRGEGTQPMQIPMPVDAGYRPHDDVPPSTRKWWHLGRNRD